MKLASETESHDLHSHNNNPYSVFLAQMKFCNVDFVILIYYHPASNTSQGLLSFLVFHNGKTEIKWHGKAVIK